MFLIFVVLSSTSLSIDVARLVEYIFDLGLCWSFVSGLLIGRETKEPSSAPPIGLPRAIGPSSTGENTSVAGGGCNYSSRRRDFLCVCVHEFIYWWMHTNNAQDTFVNITNKINKLTCQPESSAEETDSTFNCNHLNTLQQEFQLCCTVALHP